MNGSVTPKQPAAAPDPTNAAEWLKAQVEQYQAEVKRLEAQLKHTRMALKGHQIWLNQVEKEGEVGHDQP